MYNQLVSIIIPSYNEESNLKNLINRIAKNLKKSDSSYRKDIEIIIVNNGSTDNTNAVLEDLKSKFSFLKVINVEINKGYGYGIKTGFQICEGDFIGWTHADLQVDPSDLISCVDLLLSSNNKNTNFIKTKRLNRSISQRIFTRGMGLLCSLLFLCNIQDINSHPNIYPKNIIKTFTDPPDDFSLDFYFYLLAKKCGLKPIKPKLILHSRESGISKWDNNWDSKIKLIFSITLYVISFRFKFNKYKKDLKIIKKQIPNVI